MEFLTFLSSLCNQTGNSVSFVENSPAAPLVASALTRPLDAEASVAVPRRRVDPGCAAYCRAADRLRGSLATPRPGGLVDPDGRRVTPAYLRAKRVMDVVLAGSALIALFPLLLTVAALVRLTSRGPVLYVHPRVGLNGETFPCVKFRTMVVDADRQLQQIQHLNRHKDCRTFKADNDPRITPVGRWLRKLSIDELPQLWNIMTGSMSVVGPRPPLPSEVDRYSFDELIRLEATPGLTCLWQAFGRSDIPFPEQVELDRLYVENRSFWLDVYLIARTIPAVLLAHGAK